MKEIEIHTEYIKLQQVLKLAGIAGQGSDAKLYIKDSMVKVNGIIVTERGKKIRHNDIVTVQNIGEFKVIEKNAGK